MVNERENKMKVVRNDNLGVTLVEYDGTEFFIAMEDVSSVAVELICILNSERLDWREAAGG